MTLRRLGSSPLTHLQASTHLRLKTNATSHHNHGNHDAHSEQHIEEAHKALRQIQSIWFDFGEWGGDLIIK